MKRIFVWLLCFVLVEAIFSADAFAIRGNEPVRPKQAVHLSKMLSRLGSGQDALIAVRLQDRSVVSGFVAEAGPESLVVVDPGSRVEHTVKYAQVARLQGYNLVTGVEVHHGGGLRGKIAGVLRHLLPNQRVRANALSTGQKTLLIGIIIGVLIAIILAKVL